MKYFSESFPKESKDKIKILDIGAGTGLVARGVGGANHDIKSEFFNYLSTRLASVHPTFIK